MKKPTKKQFCIENPSIKKLKSTDPIQFDVLFNDWKRTTFKQI